MQEQSPVKNSRRKLDLPRLKRKFSRAFMNALREMENSSGIPREVRLVTYDDGRKVKPSVLFEYDAVGDEEQG